MILSDLPRRETRTFTLQLGSGASAPPAGPICEVIVRHELGQRPVLDAGGNSAWTIESIDARTDERLLRLTEHPARISWVESTARLRPHARVALVARPFLREMRVVEAFGLDVDERVRDIVLGRQDLRPGTFESVAAWLRDQLVIDPTDVCTDDRVLMDPTGAGTHFRLIGKTIAVDVDASDQRCARIRRVIWSPRERGGGERKLHLVRAPRINFRDASAAARMHTEEAYQELWVQLASGRDYLGIWQTYNELEREAVASRARAIGSIPYTVAVRLPDGSWQLHLTDAQASRAHLERLAEAPSLSLRTERRPDAWARKNPPSRPGSGERHARFRGRCAGVSISAGWVRLVPEEGSEGAPLDSGFLAPDVTGDETRLRRRQDARDLLVNGHTPMPQLAALLSGTPVPLRRDSRHEVRWKDVVEAFGGAPTPRQVHALDVALNTPDVALIQGPPGTGKTRVITALQTRLSQISQSEAGLSGSLLLTSYQHEAVENAASRTQVFGLPALKVDTLERRGGYDALDKWQDERVALLERRLGSEIRTPLRCAVREARAGLAAYKAGGGTFADARALLRTLLDLGVERIASELLDEVDALERDLDRRQGIRVTRVTFREFTRRMRRLRSNAESFSDDGRVGLAEVLMDPAADELLTDEERKELREAHVSAARGLTDVQLASVGAVRDGFLDRAADAGSGVLLRAVNEDVVEVAEKVVSTLLDRVRTSAEGIDEVLADYVYSLRNDRSAVRRTLGDYTVVLAATCQQAVGHQMRSIKQDREGAAAGLVFDTVIVDEAARASPLDLLIPLTRAQRRIVLVGDHRQLPHVVDSEVEHELERRRQEEASGPGIDDRFRISLFEYLFYELRRREAADGICRTVTLDAQFRMHPVLGEFISRTFYEPYGEGFTSPRDPGDLRHGIAAYADVPAAFVDLPSSHGAERGRRSKERPAEAQWVAGEVARVLSEHPDLSVGVISFYRAQIDRIQEALAEFGVMERSPTGDYTVRSEYAGLEGEDGRFVDRVRVGTVDAFQGREFDVVFLSMTRSNQHAGGDRLALRRRYGHLMLENRLCVAMSRQRRLLVLVGDSAMLEGPDAETAVPALIRYRELCEGVHGICRVA